MEEYARHSTKQLQKFYLTFKKFSPYYPTEYLADLLIGHIPSDERLYRRFINSLTLWTLDDTHPFKLLMLGRFHFNSIIGATGRKAGINVTSAEKIRKMKSICATYFVGYPIDENAAASLLPCFFKPALTKKCFRIIGLNPMNFQEPIRKITNPAPEYLIDLLILR